MNKVDLNIPDGPQSKIPTTTPDRSGIFGFISEYRKNKQKQEPLKLNFNGDLQSAIKTQFSGGRRYQSASTNLILQGIPKPEAEDVAFRVVTGRSPKKIDFLGKDRADFIDSGIANSTKYTVADSLVNSLVGHITGSVKEVAGGARKLFLPTKREILAQIEEEKGQSLKDSPELRQEIMKRIGPAVDTASADASFDEFLDASVIAPDAGVSGSVKRISGRLISELAQNVSKGSVKTRLAGLFRFADDSLLDEAAETISGTKSTAKINSTLKKLEIDSTPGRSKQPRGSGQRANEELDRMFDRKPDRKQQLKERAQKINAEVSEDWADRFATIRRFENAVAARTGIDIDMADSAYAASRLFQGLDGRIQNQLEDLGAVIRTVGNFGSKEIRNLAKFLANSRMSERAARGFDNPSGITKKEADAAMDLLRTPEIEQAQVKIKEVTDDLLEQAYEGGLISKEAFDSIKANNQNYIPFRVLADLGEAVENGTSPTGFSMSKQDVIQSLKGTERDIEDPLETLIEKIIQTNRAVERNKVAQKVARIADIPEMSEEIFKHKAGERIAKGNATFDVFENGQKVTYQAPEDVVAAMKNLTAKQTDMVTSMLAKANEVFKGGVTTFNIAFQIPNMIIDFFDAMLIARNRINLIDWAKGFASAVGKGKLYKQWREDGGAFSTYVSQARSNKMNLQKVTEGTAKRTVKTIANPIRLLEWMGSVAEETNRLAVYSKALKKGETRQFAAYDSRQASVDFARYGTKMKVVNQLIPFINARLQSTLNLARVATERPARTSLRLAFLVGAPTVATYLYNREFPEYYDIPQWEKDANFILMTGTWQDSEGNTMPAYVKIPKGHIGRLVANPIENFMVFQDSGDGTEWDKLALQTLSNLSPIDIARDGELSTAATLNSILPPIIKTPAEVQLANKSYFTGRSIVPRNRENASSENQFRDDTSALAKDVGQTQLAKSLGLSPAGFDQYVSGLLGQVGSNVVQLIDTARGKGVWMDETKDKDDRMSKIPVVSRFIGYRGGAKDQDAWEQVEQLQREAADSSVADEETAKDIYEAIRTGKGGVGEIIKDYEQQGMMTDGVRRRIRDYVRNEQMSRPEQSIKRLPTEQRARYVKSLIEDNPPDLAIQLKQLEQKGILTESVKDDLRLLYRTGQ